MERFNPITDLQPIDPVSSPTADISDEIESLRLRLIQTKKETDSVINIIKAKNSSLNSDLKKIKNLNRRLNITIPRIPSMPGEAGVQFGEEVEQEKRRKRLGVRLPPRLPLIPFPSTVTKFKRPRLRKFALSTKKALNIYAGLQTAKVGVNVVRDPQALNKIIKFSKRLTKNPLAPLSKVASKGRGASTGNPFQGAVNRVRKILNPKKVRLENDLLKLEKNIPEFQIFQFMKKANLKSPTLLKSNLNKTYAKEYQKILKAYKQNKIGVQDMLEQTDTLRKAYDTNALRIDRYGEEIMAIYEKFKMRGVGVNNTKQKFKMNDLLENIRKIKKETPKPLESKYKLESGVFQYNKNKSKVDAKSMTNDIAMLNKDTGLTNTVIILTDPPIA
tara:strand:+ start:1879 stop:3042 length:1164 start_codon:yes stop_codon:yes gene_type:complete